MSSDPLDDPRFGRLAMMALAHEMRTPLSALVLALDAGAEGAGLALEAVDRLRGLADDLLDAGFLHRDPLRLDAVDLHATCSEAAASCAPAAAAAQVHIDVHVLPAVRVLADARRLQLALRNGIHAAIDRCRVGGTVVIDSGQDDQQGWLRIIDDGRAVQAEAVDWIVEGTASAIPSRLGGPALRLALVGAIVRAHNGAIQIAVPASGSGLEVRIGLPLSPP